MRKVLQLLLAGMIFCAVATQAATLKLGETKVTCTDPFYFYAVLDSVFVGPAGNFWTVSTWPYLPCDYPGSNCGTKQCFATDCTSATPGTCYQILVSNCFDNPSVVKIRAWWPADPQFCAP